MELRFNPQTVGRLHYGFARQNQVLCLDAQSELWRLAFSPRTPSHALIEAQRVAPCPIDWVFCEDAVVLEKPSTRPIQTRKPVLPQSLMKWQVTWTWTC